jgi:23S rRNA pseudouridine1911/1915/1917 synthase
MAAMNEQNMITLSSKIPREYAGKSLLDYLSGRYAYKSREAWRAEIEAGQVTLNGAKVAPGHRLGKGDISAYTTLHAEPWVSKDVRVLWEDEFLLFLNKPAPLPAHADGAFIKNTLIHIIRSLRPGQELFLGHRLDRETSGVMVLAKSSLMLSALMPLFEKGQVQKRYLAITRGAPEQDAFDVSGGMAPDPGSAISVRWRLFPSGTPNTKESSTRFKVLQRLKGYTLVECVPLTGRTNQIRVHLASLGLGLAGDKLYGRSDQEFLDFLSFVKKGGDSRFDGRYESERHMLHAASLGFRHPITEGNISIEAGMPDDMKSFIEKYS